MSSSNLIILIGRLTADLKDFSVGDSEQHSVFKGSIAVKRPFAKNKEVDFFNFDAWGKMGANFQSWVKKGDLVKIDGYLTTFKKGEKIYYNVKVQDFLILRKSGDSQQATTQAKLSMPTTDDPNSWGE